MRKNIKNYDIICEIIFADSEDEVYPSSSLHDFQWDSISHVTLISYLSEEFDKEIELDKLSGLETIQDLDEFIEASK